ncbi:hypothetical protein MYX82_02810 [Acidobacteria bacterium AH-259-D05]|nr:hypothetical protein [Acidobacteria bacterium AH-259-D05]
MDLEAIFKEVSEQMRSDFAKAQKSLTYSGLKGEANEETVRQFLQQYLPRALNVSSGMLVDSEGKQSKQLDVVISDGAKTPIFFQSGHIRVIPAECAYAVIEIKAHLDKLELEKAYRNMKSVKTLSKKAYFKKSRVIHYTHNLYGRKWEHWPTHYFVFAYDSPGLDSVLANLNELQAHDEVHERIDTICVLDKGVILNQGQDGMFAALPTPGSRGIASHTHKPLLFFYVLMSIVLNQASMDYFNLLPYVQRMKF